MDANRFDDVVRSLNEGSTRRGISRAFAGLGLAGVIGPLLGFIDAEAKKKKKKKPKLNAFGCVNVGGACRGNDDLCCSGICEGKKPKKDKSKCVAHNTGGCTPPRSFCVTGSPVSFCAPGEPDALCYATTGNAGYCASLVGLSAEINCRVCNSDQECEAQGFPPGSACVIHTGDGCESCNGINGSEGTACVPPGA